MMRFAWFVMLIVPVVSYSMEFNAFNNFECCDYNFKYNHSNVENHDYFEENLLLNDSISSEKSKKWVNLVSASPLYGLNAYGWSVQYYGFMLKSDSKWSFPVFTGFDRFKIYSDYLAENDYLSRNNIMAVRLNYGLIGLSPMYKLNDNLFLNLGVNMIFGTESFLNIHNIESSSSIFGMFASQGVSYIPDSDIGLALGLSVYEKLLNAKSYGGDVGIKIAFGIKF